jgi:hypothetical protein
MEPEIQLANLRALLERMPNFDEYSPASQEHLLWLGHGHALIQRWDSYEAIGFRLACDFMPMGVNRSTNISNVIGTIHRAIADLELKVPDKGKVAFAAGEVYDFFKELNNLINSADSSIFIIDPYLDHTVFDQYVVSKKSNVTVRLLISKNAENVKAAAEKYRSQHGEILEVRKNRKIHDRVIFIDDFSCWVVGQSIKDAAKAKPTYLSPLSPDVVSIKLQEYNEIWNNSNQI